MTPSCRKGYLILSCLYELSLLRVGSLLLCSMALNGRRRVSRQTKKKVFVGGTRRQTIVAAIRRSTSQIRLNLNHVSVC